VFVPGTGTVTPSRSPFLLVNIETLSTQLCSDRYLRKGPQNGANAFRSASVHYDLPHAADAVIAVQNFCRKL
jgi:hypothetical protein